MDNPQAQPSPPQSGYPLPGYPPRPSASGGAAITAGVLAILLALVALVVLVMLIGTNQGIVTGRSDYQPVSLYVVLAIDLLLAVLWTLGGIMVMARKNAGRIILIVLAGVSLLTGLAAIVLGPGFSAPVSAIPGVIGILVGVVMLALTLAGSTKRWCEPSHRPTRYHPPAYAGGPGYGPAGPEGVGAPGSGRNALPPNPDQWQQPRPPGPVGDAIGPLPDPRPYTAGPAQSIPPQYPPQDSAQPPHPSRGGMAWVFAGIGFLVPAVILAVGVAMSVSSSDDPRPDGNPGAGGEQVDLTYSTDKVVNGCDIVDLSALARWVPNPLNDRQHWELKGTSAGGGSARCTASSQTTKDQPAFGLLNVEGEIQGHHPDTGQPIGNPIYYGWEAGAKGSTGSDRTTGDVPGIGTKAYFELQDFRSEQRPRLSYTLAAVEDNLSIKVLIILTVREGQTIDIDEVKTVAAEQLRTAMDRLRS
ncbi:DUF308 domain-containing protein [Nocardia thraciensis]